MTFFTALRVEEVCGKTREWVDYSKRFMGYLKSAELSQSPAYTQEFLHKLGVNGLPQPVFAGSEPWRHQLEAYNFAYPREAVMLDMDMGTGKTKVVFDLISSRAHRTALVVAPPKILESGVWEDQAIKHWPKTAGSLFMLNLYEGNITVAQRTEKAETWMESHRRWLRADLELPVYGAILINYEAVWRSPFKEWAKEQLWDLVVLEESHRAKKAGGKAAMALFDIGKRAKFRIAMSGTPMAHSPLDVYAQYRFLDCGVFGTSASNFRGKYAVFGGFQNREVVSWQNEADLHRRYFQIAFHVDESVQSLPKRNDVVRTVKLAPGLKEQYEAMKKEMVAKFGKKIATASNTLTRILRCQQITSGHITLDPEDGEAKGEVRVVGTEKRDMLSDILEDLGPNEPVVVFTKFKPDMDAVRWAAEKAGLTTAEISGRVNEVRQWQKGRVQVLAAQIRAGAEGIDLTRARYAIYYSLTHSLADYKQSRKRIHRPGQARPTTFIHLVAVGTIDREIMAALEKRQEVIDYIVNSGYFKEG